MNTKIRSQSWAASFAARLLRYITSAKAWAQDNGLGIATFCLYVICTIALVVRESLSMLARAALSVITALSDSLKCRSKGQSMARAKRNNKIDANQPQIVIDLRTIGYSVAITKNVGDGFADIVVGAHGRNFLFEIKNLDGKGDSMTPAEVDFMNTWTGQYNVVYRVEDILRVIRDAICKP